MLHNNLKDLQSSNPSSNLAETLSDSINAVEEIIYQQFSHDNLPLLEGITEHIIGSGGKRIRPLLCLAVARLINPHKEISQEILVLAASLEYIHTATLLHDDVVDEGNARRGKKTAHLIWGNQAAVLVGDHMFARAFCMLAETKDCEAIATMSVAAKMLAEGEILQLSFKQKIPDLQMHLKIISCKTASLFGAGCKASAILSGGTPQQIEHAYEFGYNFGMSFQLIDDILDYDGEKDLGKTIGSDFSEGKFTLPLILAYEKATPEEQTLIKRLMLKKTARENIEFSVIKEILKNHDSISQARYKAKEYIDKAYNTLSWFDKNPIANDIHLLMQEFLYRRH